MTSQATKNRKLRTLALASLASALTLPAVGCYTRTVESKGVGARFGKQEVYEPNMKMNKDEGDSVFDGAGDLLLGPRRIEKR